MHHCILFRIVDGGKHVLKRSDVQLKAPIHNPNKLICIGMNYVDHCLEQNVPLPTEPILFSKFNNAITDPGAPIIYPDETQVCSCFSCQSWVVVADPGGGSGGPDPPIRPEGFFAFIIIHSKTISRIQQNALFRA